MIIHIPDMYIDTSDISRITWVCQRDRSDDSCTYFFIYYKNGQHDNIEYYHETDKKSEYLKKVINLRDKIAAVVGNDDILNIEL